MSKAQKGNLFIGTSNIVVPGNKRNFPAEYQDKSRLHYYSSLFNSVELNTTFYKTPMFKTFEKWKQDVSPEFRFSIKLSRDITHAKDLDTDFDNIDRFMKAAEGMGNSKGCLLIQFPGKININYYKQVEDIIAYIHEQNAKQQWLKAVEFRSNSWYISEVFELLNQFHTALVLHDIPASKINKLVTKAPFVYFRFHGQKGDYKGSYPDKFLKETATEIRKWLVDGKDVYSYFNNTIGAAFENALSLKKLVEN